MTGCLGEGGQEQWDQGTDSLHLDPKHCWQCMAGSSAEDLGSVKVPFLAAVELDHVDSTPAVAVVEALPTLPWTATRQLVTNYCNLNTCTLCTVNKRFVQEQTHNHSSICLDADHEQRTEVLKEGGGVGWGRTGRKQAGRERRWKWRGGGRGAVRSI